MVKVGEVYSTSQNSDQLYVLQFVTRDTTQLNSDVVAIWKMSTETWQSYSYDTLPEPDLLTKRPDPGMCGMLYNN